MAGLLKQLQKNKSPRDSSVSDLLISPAEIEADAIWGEDESRAALKKMDVNIAEAEKLLSELMHESKDLPGNAKKLPPEPPETMPTAAESEASGSSSLKVVRRRQAVKNEKSGIRQEDSQPWWLTKERPSSAQVEVLLPEATKNVLRILEDTAGLRPDWKAAIHDAVTLAAKKLSGETRVTVRDQERAEKELYTIVAERGPLQQLYEDPMVTDIFIDNHHSIKVTRLGQALETPFAFRSVDEYRLFINAALNAVNHELSAASPIVDCVLDDKYNSRMNGIDSTLIQGEEPKVCIRVPRLQQISFYDLLQTKTLPSTAAAWLAEVVACREANILVVGPTGSGKTVMTSALISAIGSDERVISIEEIPEIHAPTMHLEKLVARPANRDGEGAIGLSELLQAALHRAPHRLVLGEIVDEEARFLIRALETGYTGSIATLHADSTVDGLWRLLDLIATHERSPQESIMRRIGRTIHLIIKMRKVDNRPCLDEIAEVRPPVNGEFIVETLVKFAGVVDGKRQWQLMTETSHWMKRIQEKGLALRPGPGLRGVDTSANPTEI